MICGLQSVAADIVFNFRLIKQNGLHYQGADHEETPSTTLVKLDTFHCDIGNEGNVEVVPAIRNGSGPGEVGEVVNHQVSEGNTASEMSLNVVEDEVLPILSVIPAGVLFDGDSVDGSPSPPLKSQASNLVDVMLESVDLRSASLSDSHSYAGLSPESGINKSACSLWHGNVETSTDTLVPTNALSEEENKHFPGIENGDLANFLSKREENEEVRVQRIEESGVPVQNGIDCSVYGENSFNMALLNNQSLYEPSTVAVTGAVKFENKLNVMDMSMLESVIQSQPSSSAAKRRQMDTHRHRRTPSNSKSEPSPHKFHNGK